MEKIQIQVPANLMAGLFGSFDSNIKKIEKEFNSTIINRGDDIEIVGDENSIVKVANLIKALVRHLEAGETIDEQTINYMITELNENAISDVDKLKDDVICMTVNGRALKPKTIGQKNYIDAIRKNTVVFGVGPAGTGKTYLAMAMAIKAFKNEEVNRIILTRPAIEAGENLGFLPGDLQDKVDPYLRPLYDALYEIMGAESFLKNKEKGAIEVAPLAYMRGRTLDNSFIVLDEAQNTTPEQMKMFLTRLGYGSKAVITGDITQIDLPKGKKSGLNEATKILKNIDGIKICNLTNKDVVRHPLVQKIIAAYEKLENKRDKR